MFDRTDKPHSQNTSSRNNDCSDMPAGYGNKTSSFGDDVDNSSTRLGNSSTTDSYSGGSRLGSGTTGGSGFGNKTNQSSDYDKSSTRLGSSGNTDSYYGQSEYGSGSTSGAGQVLQRFKSHVELPADSSDRFGNKTSDSYDGDDNKKPKDSTMGKLMEKAGGLMKNEKMDEKGREKREDASGGDSYGSSNSNNNY